MKYFEIVTHIYEDRWRNNLKRRQDGIECTRPVRLGVVNIALQGVRHVLPLSTVYDPVTCHWRHCWHSLWLYLSLSTCQGIVLNLYWDLYIRIFKLLYIILQFSLDVPINISYMHIFLLDIVLSLTAHFTKPNSGL